MTEYGFIYLGSGDRYEIHMYKTYEEYTKGLISHINKHKPQILEFMVEADYDGTFEDLPCAVKDMDDTQLTEFLEDELPESDFEEYVFDGIELFLHGYTDKPRLRYRNFEC